MAIYKTRLFVGEGNFNGVQAFIDKHRGKHPELGGYITATELETFGRTSDLCPDCLEEEVTQRMTDLNPNSGLDSEIEVQQQPVNPVFCSDGCERIETLKRMGVKIALGYDATRIHEQAVEGIASIDCSLRDKLDEEFVEDFFRTGATRITLNLREITSRLSTINWIWIYAQQNQYKLLSNTVENNLRTLTFIKRYRRIHWICPHDQDQGGYTSRTLPPIVRNFFYSASISQEAGDRIHVVLAQPLGKSLNGKIWGGKDFYQGWIYGIREAARFNGYRLYKKRPFGEDRYPGYQHMSNTGNTLRHPLREFIFVKDEKKRDLGSSKCFEVPTRGGTYLKELRGYYDVATENDSSSLEESSED